jgi:hypothetical protein
MGDRVSWLALRESVGSIKEAIPCSALAGFLVSEDCDEKAVCHM